MRNPRETEKPCVTSAQAYDRSILRGIEFNLDILDRSATLARGQLLITANQQPAVMRDPRSMDITLAAFVWIAAVAAVAATLVLLRVMPLFAIGAACLVAPIHGNHGTSGIESAARSADGAWLTQERVGETT
jgi:hypothetical protein